MPARTRITGFSLVELSLVLVIVGLLVGGVLVGKDLIRAAEIRGILSDYDKYNSAVTAFKLKYNGLPGDITDATNIWGVAAGNSSDNYTSSCYSGARNIPIGSQLTCNGDGNGMVAGSTTCSNNNLAFTFACNNESAMTWQHLANAGLVGGSYIPSYFGSNTLTTSPMWVRGAGGNIPSSKHNEKEGFILEYVCNPLTHFFTVCNHYFFYGLQSTIKNSNWLDFPFYPVFTAAEAFAIDSKIDDGKAGTGIVMTFKNASTVFIPNCATTTVASTAQYNTSTSDKVCALMFKASF